MYETPRERNFLKSEKIVIYFITKFGPISDIQMVKGFVHGENKHNHGRQSFWVTSMHSSHSSRKRVKQSKKNVKSHVFLDFQKNVKKRKKT